MKTRPQPKPVRPCAPESVAMPPIVPYPSMLSELRSLVDSGALADLWADDAAWQGLSIDYHPPRVERLYADLPNGHRVSLHRLHPCEPNKALWHAHPWPSAVLLLAGTYEHCTGFLDRNGLHCNARSILGAGAMYEIVDPLAWHSVRPIDGPAYSVMLTGKPWPAGKHSAPKPAPQRPLDAGEIEDLRLRFGDLLVWNKQPEPQAPTSARCGAVGAEACVYFDQTANECNACTPSPTFDADEET